MARRREEREYHLEEEMRIEGEGGGRVVYQWHTGANDNMLKGIMTKDIDQ